MGKEEKTMHGGVRIGRIFGINIRIDWSWVFILLLITWNLSVVFADTHTNWAPGLNWMLALVAALLFFASLLAHELAHSLVARSRGIPVRNITLFLFGGVSNIERDPDSPKSEFLVTIVGPLTSFVIGVVLLLIVSAAGRPVGTVSNARQTLEQLGPLSVMLLWLGSINVLLGVFNLIPGFPLDGGRVLRSIIWSVTGDLRRATRWASEVGQAVAWLFIVIGIAMVFGVSVPFFGTGLIGGVWLAFIGWFLNSAAVQSYQQIIVHDILEGVPVARMMRPFPPTVPSTISVSTLVHQHVMGTDDHAFPVVDGGRLVGLVTLEDVRSVSKEAWDSTTVQQIMTPLEKLVTATETDEATSAWDKLLQQDVRQLPVLRGSELVGLLRRRDIVKWLQLHSKLGSASSHWPAS
jgi:Zn-dependent protease/predicted transcriptional regulator